MNGYNQTPYRLGRRPGKQGPRPLPDNQGRVEKLATGKTDVMTRTKDTNRGTGVTTIKTNDGAQRLKITKDIFTVGTWNVQTLWTTGKLELLRNEMKRFRFDVVGISELDFHERIKPVEQASKMSDIWLIENIWAYNKEKLEEEFENIPLLKKEL
ncbi:unnamed protein product [Rotaria socialis]